MWTLLMNWRNHVGRTDNTQVALTSVCPAQRPHSSLTPLGWGRVTTHPNEGAAQKGWGEAKSKEEQTEPYRGPRQVPSWIEGRTNYRWQHQAIYRLSLLLTGEGAVGLAPTHRQDLAGGQRLWGDPEPKPHLLPHIPWTSEKQFPDGCER